MKKYVVYDITISEILSLIRRSWKLIGIITIAFILLCGGYKAMSSGQTEDDTLQNEDYAKNVEVYESFQNAQKVVPASLKDDWVRAYLDRESNPVYSIDPYNCEYKQLVIRFEGNESNFDRTVANWISTADDQQLFGADAESLSRYKTTIIMTEDKNTGSEETVVQLLSLKDYDVESAAKYLEKHFRNSANEEGVIISGISSATITGYNELLQDYQKRNRDEFNSIYYALESIGSIERHMTRPENLQDSRSDVIKDIIKYCILGLILGLIIGIVLVFLRAARKREVISARQVEDTYRLELLSDCSSDNQTAVDVLNANLDIMTGEQSSIAVVVDDSIKEASDIVGGWSERSNRDYVLCTDIFDNPEMIESLKKTKGIVLGVKLGDSKLEQIQSVLLRAEKLGQQVLGFVLL